MISVIDIARQIVGREGGFVNDPADPGGPTNHGVTLGTLQRLGMDVNGDGRIDIDDVRRLSEDQAVTIFQAEYFEKPRIGLLPEVLQPSVFDMQVNAGANAVKILQRLLGEFGVAVAVDGAIGPATAAAADKVARAAPLHLADAYGIARRNYYYRLGDGRPAFRKFCRRRDGGKGGWITRAEDFIAPRFHLTAQAHQQRIAAWV